MSPADDVDLCFGVGNRNTGTVALISQSPVCPWTTGIEFVHIKHELSQAICVIAMSQFAAAEVELVENLTVVLVCMWVMQPCLRLWTDEN